MIREETQEIPDQRHNDHEAISHLKEAITQGKHWYIALLEAIGLWDKAEETHQDRHYRYLVANEAFDWLLLAERLCGSVDGLIPEREKITLLFHGEPPLKLTETEFKNLIGSTKHHAYLNFFYGIVVEEALIHAVEEEVMKEQCSNGYCKGKGAWEDAYQRIYGDREIHLLERFRQEKGLPVTDSISLTEKKEFTYWLFHYRLRHCHRARVASDTRKALNHLQRLWLARQSKAEELELINLAADPSGEI